MIEVNVWCMCCTWLYLGVAPLEMEAQHRDAPLVDALGIDLAIGILVRDHFAAAGEADVRAVILVDVVFQLLCRSPDAARTTPWNVPDLRHAEAAADLDVIAAREILVLIVVEPPRHIDVHAADAVRVVARHARPARECSRSARSRRYR